MHVLAGADALLKVASMVIRGEKPVQIRLIAVEVII